MKSIDVDSAAFFLGFVVVHAFLVIAFIFSLRDLLGVKRMTTFITYFVIISVIACLLALAAWFDRNS